MPAKKTSTIRQHEPLRIPEGWEGQARSLVTQLELMMDDIYRRLGKLKEEIDELKERVDSIE